MNKCWAFYPIAGTREAWIPCVRLAEEGSRYCARHGDAITGALLGALVHAEAVDEAVKFAEPPVPAWMARETKIHTCVREPRKKKPGKRPAHGQETVELALERKLESPADDPLAGNLRVAGGSERGRGAQTPECAR